MGALELSDDWWARDDPKPPADENFAAVPRELKSELGAGHELFDRVVRVEARFGPSDDVVRLIDGTFALVHPTWSGRVESPPWPRSTGDQRLGAVALTPDGQHEEFSVKEADVLDRM